jgi:hypothetical protein
MEFFVGLYYLFMLDLPAASHGVHGSYLAAIDCGMNRVATQILMDFVGAVRVQLPAEEGEPILVIVVGESIPDEDTAANDGEAA